ncbi:hypothetical protein LIER_34292 [Lithospermum erythrorhizon]|uniref:Uncharacterized protein n=1 Tax=Lithospermum erythrorhizon TaxID=34254 RepID=A0AAV3S1B0_LITER
MSPLVRRYLHFPRLGSFVEPITTSFLTWVASHWPRFTIIEAFVQNPQEAALGPQDMGIDTPPGPEGHSSPLSPPRDQCQDPPPLANPTLVAAQENASGQYSATVVLEPEDQGGVSFATLQTPSSVPLPTPEPWQASIPFYLRDMEPVFAVPRP